MFNSFSYVAIMTFHGRTPTEMDKIRFMLFICIIFDIEMMQNSNVVIGGGALQPLQ